MQCIVLSGAGEALQGSQVFIELLGCLSGSKRVLCESKGALNRASEVPVTSVQVCLNRSKGAFDKVSWAWECLVSGS